MNDIESVFVYAVAGYVIFTDLYLLLFGVYLKLHGLGLGFQRHSDAVFFVRKLFGVTAGLALIVVYRSEMLGFFWSFIFFLILTVPESLWLIYKDTKIRKAEVIKQVENNDDAIQVRAHDDDE
ncbi:MAG: hypothetical protein ACKVQW_02715 [Pyrinomonadaceae bacterium]